MLWVGPPPHQSLPSARLDWQASLVQNLLLCNFDFCSTCAFYPVPPPVWYQREWGKGFPFYSSTLLGFHAASVRNYPPLPPATIPTDGGDFLALWLFYGNIVASMLTIQKSIASFIFNFLKYSLDNKVDMQVFKREIILIRSPNKFKFNKYFFLQKNIGNIPNTENH